MKKNRHRSFDEHVLGYLSQNPDRIDSFLEIALEEYETDHDEKALLLAIRHVVQANGSMQDFANKTGIPRESLYRMLSPSGNPTVKNLQRILSAFGYTLSFKRKQSNARVV